MQFFKKIEYINASNALAELKNNLPNYELIHIANYTNDIPAEEFYQSASDTLGIIHAIDEDKATGALTGERWIDITYDPKEPNKYRSANVRQPFHTDDSYIEIAGAEGRVTFFYCVSQATKGGATTFLTSEDILEPMQIDGENQLMEDLQKIPVKFSKGGSEKTRPILNKDNDGWIWTWNWHCIDTENNTPEALDVCQRFHDFLENRVLPAGLALALQLKPGEAVMFHDHRLLHGRNAYFTNKIAGRKLIKGAFELK
jgi:hypothetical protein